MLVESLQFKSQIRRDVSEMVPNMRTLYIDAESSCELKNRAAEAATGAWLVIVDADCIPQRQWLQVIRATIAKHPAAAAVSAKTMYPGRSRMERVLGLLSRSYLDPGRRGPTRFISGNAACARREAFLRDYATLLFDSELVVVHDFEGWLMERDIRRNHGSRTVITRLLDDRLPYARLLRTGDFAIALIVAGKTLDSVRDCLRCVRHSTVKAYQLPLASALTVATHILEIPWLLAAYRGQTIGATA
jgi:glycosyl transferase family 2